MQTDQTVSDRLDEMRELLKKAERHDGLGNPIGGTAATVLKFRQPPIAGLAHTGQIGPEELRAADEIERVIAAMTGALWLHAQSYELAGGHGERDLAIGHEAERQRRYRIWARYWSNRRKRCRDRTLAVVVAAVVDEAPLSGIDQAMGWRHSTARLMLIAGLRDYAARAGWVTGSLRQQWMQHKKSVYRSRRRA